MLGSLGGMAVGQNVVRAVVRAVYGDVVKGKNAHTHKFTHTHTKKLEQTFLQIFSLKYFWANPSFS